MLLAASARGQELFLDLTKPSKAEAMRTSGCGEGGLGGGDHGAAPPVLPLGLQVVSLNANVYKEGDELTSELLLTNNGDMRILIPTTRDAKVVYAEGCKRVPTKPGARALLGDMTLVFQDAHGFKEFIASHQLYGVSDDSTTYVELGPGKSLRIKTAGKVHLYNIIVETNKANLAFNLPLQVGVHATFSLDDPILRGYQPTTSRNRLEVTLEAN